ncbi:MAG TPA: GDP-mannose 4,6-dehydratase [Chitinophagaceae bacterium]|nr:GDP-mannose 4,6-dehydratase [Chitinophagaceae bacterium]
MKHYLVTGGAGFIGSNLIGALYRNDPEARITCIDDFDPFYSPDLKNFNIRGFRERPGFRLLTNDLSRITGKDLAALVEAPVDVIVHLAAKAGVRPSILDPLAYQQSNVIGLQNMLDFAREENIKQFVFASSSSVYGVNDHFPWKEEERLLPISPYASTKLSGEMMGHVYSKLFGIRFIALRFFTVYGPGQRPDLAIHKFMKAILIGKPITVYGDGSTSRDYTYVDDTVEGIIGAIGYEQSNFEIINLGNNYTIPLMDLIRAIEEVTGKKAIIETMPDQPGDVPKTYADISKAKRLLGYQPKTKLMDGLRSFYDWLIRNGR